MTSRLSPPRRLSLPLGPTGDMAVREFGDPERPVDLIFVHANGFNAATYTALLEPLADRMRIWAPDLRGHGGTTLPAVAAGRRGWSDHADDLVALLDGLDGPPVALAGHSMGATTSLLAAARRPDRVSRLVLLDPVIWSRWAVAAFQLPLLDRLPGRIPLVRNALRRRDRFDSRDAALAAYRGRGAFKGWPDRVLADYLSDGLVSADEGLALACAPAWEASNYAAQSHDPWRALRRFPHPVQVLKAEANSPCHLPVRSSGQSWGQPNVTVQTVPGGTHFFPMLQPEIARAALAV